MQSVTLLHHYLMDTRLHYALFVDTKQFFYQNFHLYRILALPHHYLRELYYILLYLNKLSQKLNFYLGLLDLLFEI